MRILFSTAILISTLPSFALAPSKPCGLTGTIEERIRDCSEQKRDFVLVTRTPELHEIYKDTVSGLIWSDRLTEEMIYWDAEKACGPSRAETGGISEVSWRMPTIEEFQDKGRYQVNKVLPNMVGWTWTSSTYNYPQTNEIWSYLAQYGISGHGVTYDSNYREKFESVRCVGTL
jgi:hypothetical protein